MGKIHEERKINVSMEEINEKRKGILALSPIIILLSVYLIGSIVAGDFYRVPIAVSFLIASVYAIAITKGKTLLERIDHFSEGAGEKRILYMTWIFVFAGAFASIAKTAGAVDATVNITLQAIPTRFLPAGIFIATCFISMSIGTSVGAIVALVPVVTGIAEQTGYNLPWLVAIVVGGAFFGDNLSFISDTTIATTQTQGCSMRDKFRTNFRLVLPAAILTLLIYCIYSPDMEVTLASHPSAWWNMMPYLLVIVLALCGLNVLVVLLSGIVVASFIGVATGSLGVLQVFTETGAGILNMCELIIVTMLAGGLLEIVRLNGGLDFLTRALTQHIRSKRGAEASITTLTALANVCTANNTIAILTVGDITRRIAKEYKISARRSASLMDTASCVVQGFIPYGAQLLMAAGLANVSPLEVIPNLYYPMAIALSLFFSILFKRGEKR